jgi:hypothetical protein
MDSFGLSRFLPSVVISLHRWRFLSLPWFLELSLSLSSIGWLANVKDGIFLRGPKSCLLLETFFLCPGHLNGRRLQSGDENIVRGWSSAQYSSNIFRRYRYYSRQCLGHINCHFKLVQSRHRPPWWKIQYLLQQVCFSIPSSGRCAETLPLVPLDHTLPCSTNCKFLVSDFEDNRTDTIVDLAGVLVLVCSPMGMLGGHVAEHSQNTSIPPIPVSTNRVI